ncbi:hypothetical protein CHS0354_019349 [Potamilus streckersoni]|uniref:Uncharacterized protein n=1 Tax=Potamilus streckersoni TaxID=2493646 RepID=A0AAE0SHJ8_9BIVA|nr:hypothetical protein CHS0354_019349 [Potamilus streckersoni]
MGLKEDPPGNFDEIQEMHETQVIEVIDNGKDHMVSTYGSLLVVSGRREIHETCYLSSGLPPMSKTTYLKNLKLSLPAV